MQTKTKRPFPLLETILAVAAVCALVVAAWLNNHDEERSTRYDTMSTYDAASGGYRAWYELLGREGVRVARFERRPAFLDDSVDVYIAAQQPDGPVGAASLSSVWTEADWDAVSQWVHRGGRLVWITEGGAFAAVLTAIQGSRPGTDLIDAPPVVHTQASRDAAVTISPSPLTSGVASVSGTSAFRVRFDGSGRAAPLVADPWGAIVVTYTLGRGTVVLVTDPSLFQNRSIARAGNARLSYDLAAYGLTKHGAVAFDEWSHGYAAADTWWGILPPQFRPAFVAAATALILLLIGTALRFGPTARLPENNERTSAEYLDSMAQLYERAGAVKSAIIELADGALFDVATALGTSQTASATALARRVQTLDTAEDLAEAVMDLDRLRSYEHPHPSDLLRAAQLSALLRKEFSRHARIGIGRRAPARRRIA